MDILQVHRSGILKKGEDICEHIEGTIKNKNNFENGMLVITNKRFLFLKKPGFFSKGLNVIFTISLGDILSVSITGLISKKLNINIKTNSDIETNIFSCKNVEIFAKKLIDNKNKFIDEKIIDAKKVIIEEGNKDNAMEILKKRLARGEITLDEFHEKVQRT